MASYLSYFTSNNLAPSQPSQQQRPSTPSSTWSSTFSSRITSLRKALTKDSEEDDPNSEDCSHVSNVLRAYYTEKGQGFPEWLPPDPKKPPPVVSQPPNVYGQGGNVYGGYGGSQYANTQPHGRAASGGRGGLSDLWDPSPAQSASAVPTTQSLRAPRATPQSLRGQDPNASGLSRDSPPVQQSSGARPLPSQRAGSYQTTPSASAGGLGSRDRLRARLQGGEKSSSSLGSNSGQQTPSAPSSQFGQGSGAGSPYVSASEPWSTGGDDYGFGGGYSGRPTGDQYTTTQSARQRPGGPR